MAQAINRQGNFTLQVDKEKEPMLLLEWLSTRVENRNPVHKVRSYNDHFSIELNLNWQLHDECAKFINAKSDNDGR
jgi:hypothetical protein